MVKPKAQTLQQKLGFLDEDLKKPDHDKLMKWLDKNIESIVNNLFNKPFTEIEISEIKDQEQKKINTIIDKFDGFIISFQKELAYTDSEKRNTQSSFRHTNEELQVLIANYKRKKKILKQFDIISEIPDKPRITRIKKEWEVPVTTGHVKNIFTIGFIDFAASFSIPHLELSGLKYSQENEHSKLEYYDIDENQLKFTFSRVDKRILVEVKTEINSLGALIRQINQYRVYLQGNYYIMCPDNSDKDILREQGIGFIDFDQK